MDAEFNTTHNIRPRYPVEFTKFKTNNYIPGNHFTNTQSRDWFSANVPNWNLVLNHFFGGKKDLRFLELGTHVGMCSNYLLDTYDCTLDTVDVTDRVDIEEEGKKYYLCTKANLKPFLDNGRCIFHKQSTKDFLMETIWTELQDDEKYDFIYIDASHEPDDVMSDAVLSFELLKKDGLMIFDDYGWGDCAKGIDGFITAYEKKLEVFEKSYQVFIRKY